MKKLAVLSMLVLVLAGCRYAGMTEGAAKDAATTAVANQRADAETIRLIDFGHGKVLGQDAWVFEYRARSRLLGNPTRFCAYVWWDDAENETRSIVGACP